MVRSISADDIKEVQKILRRWRENALIRRNKKAQKEVELIIRVIDLLYVGGKTK